MLLCYNVYHGEVGTIKKARLLHGKEVETMPIKYDKLIKRMQEAGITSYTIKRDKIIGQATYKKIMEGGDIDTRTIAKLCKVLHCQPGDLMEYTEEDNEQA